MWNLTRDGYASEFARYVDEQTSNVALSKAGDLATMLNAAVVEAKAAV
jgi:hypothetical protein